MTSYRWSKCSRMISHYYFFAVCFDTSVMTRSDMLDSPLKITSPSLLTQDTLASPVDFDTPVSSPSGLVRPPRHHRWSSFFGSTHIGHHPSFGIHLSSGQPRHTPRVFPWTPSTCNLHAPTLPTDVDWPMLDTLTVVICFVTKSRMTFSLIFIRKRVPRIRNRRRQPSLSFCHDAFPPIPRRKAVPPVLAEDP